MVAVRRNFYDVQVTTNTYLYSCEYFLVGLASIISADNTLISGKRNIVEKMMKSVCKEGVKHNVEDMISVLLT